MPRLYHPALGAYADFADDRSAAVARESGWTDPPEPEPDEPGLPSVGDSKARWVDAAEAAGWTRSDAQNTEKDELIRALTDPLYHVDEPETEPDEEI